MSAAAAPAAAGTSAAAGAPQPVHDPSTWEPRSWQQFTKDYRGRFVDDCVIRLSSGTEVRVVQSPSAKRMANAAAGGAATPGKQQQRGKAQQGRGAGRSGAARGAGRGNASGQGPLPNGGLSSRGGGGGADRRSDPALTGTTVWDGAIVLGQYLTAPNSPIAGRPWPSGRRLPVVLELGAGTGAVSLCLLAARAVEGAVLTDIPDCLEHLQRNLAHNVRAVNPAQALVASLLWGDTDEAAAVKRLVERRWRPPNAGHPPWDVIIGSDLIYYSYSPETPHSRLLLEALRQLCGPETVVLLSLSLHHNPQEVEQFLRWAEEDGFVVTRVPPTQLPPEYAVPDVMVAQLRLLEVLVEMQGVVAAAVGAVEDCTGLEATAS